MSITKVAEKLGTTCLPDNSTHKFRMEIHSETSSRVYIVAQNNRNGVDHGRWECSCMGWKRWRKCKHLTAMLPTLKLLDADTTSAKAQVKKAATKKPATKRALPAKSEVTLNHWERLMGVSFGDDE